MEIDRTKIDDIGLLAGAILELQKSEQPCPAIIKAVTEVFEEHIIKKETNDN